MRNLYVRVLAVFILIISALGVFSQTYVSTQPQNKNAIIEEFTGVKCGNCPAGHTIVGNLLTTYPGRLFVVGYHPSNSSFTTPYSGDPDFRRSYADAFYSTPYCGSSRFMPSAFINRRVFSGERIQSRGNWETHANSLMAESSPLNVGIGSNYNSSTNQLTVTVEVYFTADVTDPVSLMVTLAENHLTAQQSGGTSNYDHKHVFREALNTGQWGDAITGNTTQGSLYTATFTFDNSTAQYDMSNCELMAFVVNGTSDEVVSGIGVDVGESTAIENVSVLNFGFDVYPNPLNNSSILSLNLPQRDVVSVQIFNLVGELMVEKKQGLLNAGNHQIPLSKDDLMLRKGLYMVKVIAGNDMQTHKIIVK